MTHLVPLLFRARRRVPIHSPYVPPDPNPNLLLWSEEFQQVEWVKTSCVVTEDAADDPNGAPTADLLDPSSAGGLAEQQSPDAVVGGEPYTFSVYVRRGPGNAGDDAAIQIIDDVGLVASALFSPTTSWSRTSLSGTLSAGATFALARIITNNEEDNAIYAWGAKLEEGSQVTAYVKREGV